MRFIFELVEAGKIDGLRIDHSDGLFDPQEYFERLQERFGAQPGEKPLYVVTEKILAAHERLPTNGRCTARRVMTSRRSQTAGS